MGLIMAKLWHFIWSNQEYKVIIVGLDNAGKTTILYRHLTGEVVQASPTIGSNVEEVKWRNVNFVMWDIGGQTTLRSSWSTYYCNTHFVVIVVDSTDRERIPVIRDQFNAMLKHEDLRKAAILVYANKQDLKNAMKAAEVSNLLDLTSIKTHKWQIQACSALTGQGVQDGLEWMVDHLNATRTAK